MIPNPYNSPQHDSTSEPCAVRRRTIGKNFVSFLIVAFALILLAPQPQNRSGDLAYSAILASALVTVSVDAFVSQRLWYTLALIAFVPIALTILFLDLRPMFALLNGANYWELLNLAQLWVAGIVASGLSIGLSTLDMRYST